MSTAKYSADTASNTFLAIVEDEAQACVQIYGGGPKDLIAAALVRRIVERCPGFRVEIPRKTKKQKTAMREDIARRYDGRNAQELARQWGVSVRHVRRIAQQGRLHPGDAPR